MGRQGKRKIHLAQFLVHGPTFHSLAMWRHPWTDHANYPWNRPELYQHIARVCERGRFDMLFFADLNYISDTYRSSLEPALRYAVQAPEHDPIPLLSYMGAVTKHIGLAATFSTSHSHPFYAARPDRRPRGLERCDVTQPEPRRQLRRRSSGCRDPL